MPGNFPPVQKNRAMRRPISGKTLTAILQVVNNTSLEILQYALKVIVVAHKNAGSPTENMDSIKRIEDHIDKIQAINDKMTSPWDPSQWEDRNIIEMYNEILSDEAVENLAANLPQVEDLPATMYYNIEDDGRFLRVYLQEGEVMDEERTSVLDTLWNLWLTIKKMICQDGVVYHSDNQGNPKNKVTKPELDKEIGSLEGFFSSKNVNVSVQKYEEEAPAPTAEAEKTRGAGRAT